MPIVPVFNPDEELPLPLQPGERVGHFRVVRLAGQGAMGSVFEAIHEQIERRVAIKVLNPQFAAIPQLVNRFINEARAVNRSSHPGLVQIFDFGWLDGGLPYLVMEYLDGLPLSERMLSATCMPVSEALPLFRQIAFTLAAAHAKGIIHRDLKPENVLVYHEPDPPHQERVKVIDFGLAKLATDASHETAVGTTMGTPRYMSPEQCLGLVNVDGKTDVYALGVMLYEALLGRPPFLAQTSYEYMTMHVNQEPPPIGEQGTVIPPEVAVLVHAMLIKKLAQRPGMAWVARELARLEGLRDLPESATTIPPAAVRQEMARILVIDDDVDLAESLQSALEAAGHDCHKLIGPQKALETVRSLRPHVILLDVQMPGMTGYKLCWELKSKSDTKDIIVVLMSSKSTEADQKLGLAMQADAYLVKPFSLTHLLSVIQLLVEWH